MKHRMGIGDLRIASCRTLGTMLGACLVLMPIGCSRDPEPEAIPVPESRTLSLKFSSDRPIFAVTDQPADSPDTDQSAIRNIWVLQYDTGTDAGGELVGMQKIESFQSIDQGLWADVRIKPMASTRIVAIANDSGILSLGGSGAPSVPAMGSSLADLDLLGAQVTATLGRGLPADDSGVLPMRGECLKTSIDASDSELSISLVRLVAKLSFTFVNSTKTLWPRFEPESVQLHNVPSKVGYKLVQAASHGQTPPVLCPAAEQANFISYDAVPLTEGQYQWFVTPNSRGQGTAADAKDKSSWTAPAGQGDYCTYVELTGKIYVSQEAMARGESIPGNFSVFPGGNATTDYNLWSNAAYNIGVDLKAVYGEDDYDFDVEISTSESFGDTIYGWDNSLAGNIVSQLTVDRTAISWKGEQLTVRIDNYPSGLNYYTKYGRLRVRQRAVEPWMETRPWIELYVLPDYVFNNTATLVFDIPTNPWRTTVPIDIELLWDGQWLAWTPPAGGTLPMQSPLPALEHLAADGTEMIFAGHSSSMTMTLRNYTLAAGETLRLHPDNADSDYFTAASQGNNRFTCTVSDNPSASVPRDIVARIADIPVDTIRQHIGPYTWPTRLTVNGVSQTVKFSLMDISHVRSLSDIANVVTAPSGWWLRCGDLPMWGATFKYINGGVNLWEYYLSYDLFSEPTALAWLNAMRTIHGSEDYDFIALRVPDQYFANRQQYPICFLESGIRIVDCPSREMCDGPTSGGVTQWSSTQYPNLSYVTMTDDNFAICWAQGGPFNASVQWVSNDLGGANVAAGLTSGRSEYGKVVAVRSTDATQDTLDFQELWNKALAKGSYVKYILIYKTER